MKLLVNLKLKLSKIRKTIVVSYNTYEKASFDTYLAASLALRAVSKKEAFEYIDDITGQGSLNAHFKKLYIEASEHRKATLKNVMNNSMYPILKIDRSNKYDYYPDLDVSLYKNKIYYGDLQNNQNINEILQLGDIDLAMPIEFEAKDVREYIDPYLVRFAEDINVKIGKEWINMPSSLFEDSVIIDLDNVDKYEGTIHKNVDDDNWSILTNSVINNLYSNGNYFYSNGDHCQIRNKDVRKTIVAKLFGFYIYKEECIVYEQNETLCNEVLDILYGKSALTEIKQTTLLELLRYSDAVHCQKVVNYILNIKDSQTIANIGVDMLNRGVEQGWSARALTSFIKYSTSISLNKIYLIDSSLNYSLEQLLKIDTNLLTESHLNQVFEYQRNRNEKIAMYTKIIGEVTASGLREKVKQLKSDNKTKRFSKLANEHIGHKSESIEKASDSELDVMLKQANEMLELMKELKNKIK